MLPDAECFELMKQAGCLAVFLGIESGDQSVLNNMNKSAKLDRYAYGIEKLHNQGIATFASLIVGFPGETTQTIQNTIAFLDRTAPTFYQAALYYHYPATPIHQRREEFRIQRSGYSWRHSTMSWQEAAAGVQLMYRTVRGSTVLPLFGFDFFGIPYFLSRGISFDQYTAFLKGAQPMLIESYDDAPVDFSGPQAALMSVFRPAAARAPIQTVPAPRPALGAKRVP
jgi:Radical SAM superfamily